MRKSFSIAVLAFASIAYSQQAKVIQLSPADAAEAKKLADEQDALIKKIDDFREALKKKYLTTFDAKESGNCIAEGGLIYSTLSTWGTGTTPIGGDEPKRITPATPPPPIRYYKKGWGCGGFEYSDDFNFIVPLMSDTAAKSCGPTVFSSPVNKNIAY